MRSYTLVPTEMVQTWQGQRQPTPQQRVHDDLRHQMNQTLNTVPDTVEGFAHFADKFGKFMESKKDPPSSTLLHNVTEGLPHNLKTRGTALLQRLLRDGRFKVGEYETVHIDDEPLNNSNVLDLIRFFSGKSTQAPPGAEALQNLMEQINVPSTLAPNKVTLLR